MTSTAPPIVVHPVIQAWNEQPDSPAFSQIRRDNPEKIGLSRTTRFRYRRIEI
ncbi:hypothetical protein RESH_05992 [Rhodopirellula europaea SH398]|uniref:Uncharacterized protein n=1 Tax=Rhodopirellula europaea SH398 TaxID=1263868 RepID=M5SBF8_9BACT|nr:hypothetical protein RESH_05992 [Rhodopirellula europaea SH398]